MNATLRAVFLILPALLPAQNRAPQTAKAAAPADLTGY